MIAAIVARKKRIEDKGHKPEVTLVVELEKQASSAIHGGSCLHGKVLLDVTKDAVPAKSLNIKFVGVESSQIVYWHKSEGKDSQMEARHSNQSHEFIGIELVLHTFDGGLVDKGKYVFPFEFVLPVGLPGKQGTRAREGDSFAIQYFLEAHLNRGNISLGTVGLDLAWEVKTHAEIMLADPHYFSETKSTSVAKPVVTPMSNCFCLSGGAITISGQLDSMHVSEGDTMKIECDIVNDSSTRIDVIEVFVMERQSFKAHTHEKKLSKEFFCARVEGKDIEGAQPMAKRRGGGGATVVPSSYVEGGGSKKVINVPFPVNVRPSYQHGVLGKVTHHLMLVFVTSGCSLNPEIIIPIVVHRRSADFSGVIPFVEVEPEYELPEGWSAGASVSSRKPSLKMPSLHHHQQQQQQQQRHVPQGLSSSSSSFSSLPPPTSPEALILHLQSPNPWLETNTLMDWLSTGNAKAITPEHMGLIFGSLKSPSYAVFASSLGAAMFGMLSTSHVVAAALESPKEYKVAVCTGFAHYCTDKGNAPSAFAALHLPSHELTYVLTCY